jgi:hypothetical protein
MAGFVAVAAGAIMPDVGTSISTIYSKIASAMTEAASRVVRRPPTQSKQPWKVNGASATFRRCSA